MANLPKYYENSFVFFPLGNEDNRIHPKTVIFGVEINDTFKAYREDDLIELGKIEDNVAGRDIIVKRNEGGIVTITDTDTGEEIVKERDFWFAWYAFHPETELYLPENTTVEPFEGETSPSTPLGGMLTPMAVLVAFFMLLRKRN